MNIRLPIDTRAVREASSRYRRTGGFANNLSYGRVQASRGTMGQDSRRYRLRIILRIAGKLQRFECDISSLPALDNPRVASKALAAQVVRYQSSRVFLLTSTEVAVFCRYTVASLLTSLQTTPPLWQACGRGRLQL